MYSTNTKLDADLLKELLFELGALLYTHDLVIDSRRVNNNSIFCAYPGVQNSKFDGREFIDDAINKGAQYIIYEDDDKYKLDIAIPHYKIRDLRFYIGLLAAHKYSFPSSRFKTVGVTGTNGKTSITHWLNQAYTLKGYLTGIIGTTGAGLYPAIQYNNTTTPDMLTLQHIMSDFAAANADMVAMEVSSHALHQGRVNGVEFTTAVFTNLTQDHLDYHKSMEDYYLAKRELFFWHNLAQAVINVDDEYGKRLYTELMQQHLPTKVLDYGINSGTLRAIDIKTSFAGTTFKLCYNDESIIVTVNMIGRFNVYNLLAVAATLILDNWTLAAIATTFANLTPVSGRMDTIYIKDKPLVVVDFAHTPDSMENILATLNEIVPKNGRIYCVFGCGGNRDTLKRPVMGEIASRLSHQVIITSDNPRFEEPSTIIEQIVAGIKQDNYCVIENRKEAIAHALKCANASDIVVIAGKGHETYQEIKDVKEPFSDLEVASSLLL